MPKNKRDWLNNFIEKNIWGILIALFGVISAYTSMRFQVQAQDSKIKSIEQAQIVIAENQRDIIELQINQANMVDDISEIKTDVKTLLNNREVK